MAVSAAELQELYLAYFGRPADRDGLAYYTSQAGLSIWDVANAFSASPESQALYGSGFGASAIQRIYGNLFNRSAEADGVLYWSQQVASGKLSAAGAALGILLGAQNQDHQAVQNKLGAAAAFTLDLVTAGQLAGYVGDPAAAAARNFLAGVTGDPLSLVSAIANAAKAVPVKVIDMSTTGLNLDAMPSGGTIEVTADGQSEKIAVTHAADSTNDILSIELSKAGALAGVAVDAAGVETLSIAANDTSAGASPGAHAQSLALTDGAVTSVRITGNATLDLGTGAGTHAATIDASQMTGALVYTTSGGDAQHVIGGAGADMLQSKAGLDLLTGGAGNDVFAAGAPSSLNAYATITDASTGDIVKLANAVAGTATMSHVQLALGATAVFQDYANAVVNAGGDASVNPFVTWFEWAGDTYLVASEHNAAAVKDFQNGIDVIVKLAGLHDLSTASLNTAAGAAVLVQLNS